MRAEAPLQTRQQSSYKIQHSVSGPQAIKNKAQIKRYSTEHWLRDTSIYEMYYVAPKKCLCLEVPSSDTLEQDSQAQHKKHKTSKVSDEHVAE